MEIGERICLLREERQETQQELSSGLNVSREVVAKWENGTRDLKTKHTISLAKYFNVSADYLLGLTDIRIYPQCEKDKKIEELTWKVVNYEHRIYKANKALNEK